MVDVTALTGRLNAAEAAWQSYVPTFNGNLGNGSLTGRFKQMPDKTVHFAMQFVMGSSTVVHATAAELGLPVPCLTAARSLFAGGGMRQGNSHGIHWRLASDTTVFVYNPNGNVFNAAGSFAMAAGNDLRISGTYERA